MTGRSRSIFVWLLAAFLGVAFDSRRPAFPEDLDSTPSGLSPVDSRVDACADFYRYACGPWREKNPIPAGQGHWMRLLELQQRNDETLRAILERISAPRGTRGEAERRLGDFYASCMDETQIERLDASPLRADLDRIEAIRSRTDLAFEIARLQMALVRFYLWDVGIPDLLFGFGDLPDPEDATRIMAGIDEGRQGLPNRDYYLKDDPDSRSLRQAYREHVRKTFLLLGETASRAAHDASRVLELEESLARASRSREGSEDFSLLTRKFSLSETAALAPSFDWAAYFRGLGVPPPATWVVSSPGFLAGLEPLLKTLPLENWRAYLRWNLARAWSPLLSRRFVAEDFEFYTRRLSGARQEIPRWKRCAGLTSATLQDELGRIYVEENFAPESRREVEKLLQQIRKEMEEEIRGLSWMTEATRARALEKLGAVVFRVGHPDRWRDYSDVTIRRGELIGNLGRAHTSDARRRLSRIGQRVDRAEWLISAASANADFDWTTNSIHVAAGILQPPFYRKGADRAVNLGAIGYILAHELVHGFDSEGRQFDGEGNIRDWWEPEDAAEFERRAACVVREYSDFVAAPGVHLDGQQTLGENLADNGGARLAYRAFVQSRPERSSDPATDRSAAQRFFVALAQVHCGNYSEASARQLARASSGAFGEFRVNGVVSNMPEFAAAFGCPAGSRMVRKEPCRVW